MEIFWLDDPEILAKNYKEILPTKSQSIQGQLNALTRLILLITLILLIVHFELWYIFLLSSIALILMMAILIIDTPYSENYSERDRKPVSSYTKTVGNRRVTIAGATNTRPTSRRARSTLPTTSLGTTSLGTTSLGTTSLGTTSSSGSSSGSSEEEYSNKTTPLVYTTPVSSDGYSSEENHPAYLSHTSYTRIHSRDIKRVGETGVTSLTSLEPPDINLKHGTDAAFSNARHKGSLGYVSADPHNSSTDLFTAKNRSVESHFSKESKRRDNLIQGYSRKKENDLKYFQEYSGYTPSYDLYTHPEQLPKPKSYNGYTVL